MDAPGAARSTVVRAQLDKPGLVSRLSLAATEMMFGKLRLAGYAGTASLSELELPAAATKRMPRSRSPAMADSSAVEVGPPQLLLVTRMLWPRSCIMLA